MKPSKWCCWCGRNLTRVGTGRRLADGSGWECRRPCSQKPYLLTEHRVYAFPTIPAKWVEPDDHR